MVLNNKTIRGIVKPHSASQEIWDNSTCTQWTCTQSHHPIKKSALCIIQGKSESLKMLCNKKLIYKSWCKRTCRHCFPSPMAADLLKMCVYVDYAYNLPFTSPHADVYSRHRESKIKRKEKTSVRFTHRNECHNQQMYSMVKDEE